MNNFQHRIAIRLPGGIFSESTQDSLQAQSNWLDEMGISFRHYDTYFCQKPEEYVLNSVNSAMMVVYCFDNAEHATLFKLAFG